MQLRFAFPFLALACSAAASSVDRPTPDRSTRERLAFFHWWTSPSEAAALDALVAMFKTRHPEIDVEPTVAGRGTAAILPVLREQAKAGAPPDAVFAHGGYSPEELVRAGLLAPVDDVWKAQELEGMIPAVVREMSRQGERYYVVPLGLHRDNVVWYHKPLLARHGIDPDTLTTWDALFAAAAKLRAAGVTAPVQLGETWTAVHAFAGVVASQGLSGYEDWANGKLRKPGDARLRGALEVYERYVALANTDHAGLAWDAAIERVARGQGAFAIMGDWADGVFRAAGLAYGKDYGTLPIPGTRGLYGVTLDAFARPAGLARTTSSDRWLSLVASREGQDAFNARKGSIPPRTDADSARYSPYSQSAIRDFRSAERFYPGFGTAVPDAYQAELKEIVADFLRTRDVAATDERLAQAAVRHQAAYTRTWALQE